MITLGVLIFFAATLLPGMMILKMLDGGRSVGLRDVLYAVGLGLLFNIAVGAVANFTFGISLLSVVCIYVVLLVVLVILKWRFGAKLAFGWRFDWKLAIPVVVYLVAVGLQYQTTLVSSNLIGSDVHLEYYYANRVVETGYWDYSLPQTTVNSSLGIVLLLPVYSLLAPINLMWVFKVIAPLIFAFLPVALYCMFRSEFGKLIAILAVVFFVAMPMFTMDIAQLVRQQHSELFFILMVLLMLDGDISVWRRAVIGVLFSAGVVVSHHGFAIGATGYFLIGTFGMVVMARFVASGIGKLKRSLLPATLMMGLAVVMVGMFVSYYSWVANGDVLGMGMIPMRALERTTSEAQAGMSGNARNPPAAIQDIGISEDEIPAIVKDYPFLNPFWREPLLQTAIGLDYARASSLGKIWRVLQYLVEFCLVVGFFVFLFGRKRRLRLEYAVFAITSFCVLLGMYLLSTYSYGMGATRVWQVTLIFMSPLFVIGVGIIGKWILRKRLLSNGLVLGSFLVLFLPYCVFNSGAVYEMVKMEPAGYVDVPYSIAMSGQRVDVATVFDSEDVAAVDWLAENADGSSIFYGDAHGVRLLIQKFGIFIDPDLVVGGNLASGRIRSWEGMGRCDKGYIFLRKLNIDRNIITVQGEYGCRVSYNIDDVYWASRKVSYGEVVYDNGAKIIKVAR